MYHTYKSFSRHVGALAFSFTPKDGNILKTLFLQVRYPVWFDAETLRNISGLMRGNMSDASRNVKKNRAKQVVEKASIGVKAVQLLLGLVWLVASASPTA